MNDRPDKPVMPPAPPTAELPWDAPGSDADAAAGRVGAAVTRRNRVRGWLGGSGGEGSATMDGFPGAGYAEGGYPAPAAAEPGGVGGPAHRGQELPPTQWGAGQFPAPGRPDGVGAGGMPDGEAGTPVDEHDLDLLDPAWTPPKRIDRLTLLLAGALVIALGFAGGVLVQKRHDAGLATTSSAGAALGRAFSRVNGGGGTGGFGGTGGTGDLGSATTGQGGLPGAGASPGGAATGGGAGSGAAAGGTPVVVGKVVSVAAGTLVVQNFAGAKVTVHVPAGTPVTTAGLTGLVAGATVSVTGSKAADGSVNATSVVSRGNG
jgi:hypothetical protein